MGLLLGILGIREAGAAGVSYTGDPAILERIGANAGMVAPPA
jgi:hypothetical protein